MQSCGYYPQGTTKEGTCCTWACDNFYGTHMKYLWSILRDLAQESEKELGSMWSPPCWSSYLHRIQVLGLSKGQLENERKEDQAASVLSCDWKMCFIYTMKLAMWPYIYHHSWCFNVVWDRFPKYKCSNFYPPSSYVPRIMFVTTPWTPLIHYIQE